MAAVAAPVELKDGAKWQLESRGAHPRAWGMKGRGAAHGAEALAVQRHEPERLWMDKGADSLLDERSKLVRTDTQGWGAVCRNRVCCVGYMTRQVCEARGARGFPHARRE